MDLQSLNNIFKERVFRIPDYQRGYAWTKPQLEDFWEDLVQLESERVHYTGVITLEPVTSKAWSKWDSDQWLIEDVDYKPFYVVDGQQRLTTSIILIQAITESVPQGSLLASQSVTNILKKFVLFKADDGIRESYIFGYEKDNPSDEYLRTRIFGMYSHSNTKQETLYTRNLITAKNFFKERLSGLQVDDIEVLYKKITQKFKFNLYEIKDDIDVFVTFETMNNRGKALTSLELLKNRLIYLSTLFKDHSGREKLRSNINDAWKTIYEYLGKNPEVLLSDNQFLRNHWIMYFKYSRQKGDDHIKFLLDEKFKASNVTHPKTPNDELKIEEISEYVKSLQQSIVHWFYMHNPYYGDNTHLTESQKKHLDQLERLSFKSFKPLILSAFVSEQQPALIVDLLVAMERYNFTLFNLSQRRANTGDTEFFMMSRELLKEEKDIKEVVSTINSRIKRYYDSNKFLAYIQEKYEYGSGFYSWDGVRYFLFEYEQSLRAKGKQAVDKLSWHTFKANPKDHVTLEHIFPQTPDCDYWQLHYGQLTDTDRHHLTHSLGNLLPLSRAKNSSLKNAEFALKVNNGAGVGYYNGSVSENEVAQCADWTPVEIRQRGLDLLKFMEQRWGVVLGDDDLKLKLLHLANISSAAQPD